MLRAMLVFVLFCCLGGVAEAADGDFGRLYPDLPALTGPGAQDYADLAQTMLDPGLMTEDNCIGDACTGSGYTYFGQFVDHDLTLDTIPLPAAGALVDPVGAANGRTFKFDLDQVYGAGPLGSPDLYEADGVHLKVQNPSPNGVQDLPRTETGGALVGDPRQDENQIISQLQTAFLLAHNRLVDSGLGFDAARRTLTLAYQQAVLGDYLPHVAAPVDRRWLARDITRLTKTAMTPIEFSVAAFRFGHSQVRDAYFLNEDLNVKVPVFRLDGGEDLSGGKPLQSTHQLEWVYFFPELEATEQDHLDANHGRLVDPLISSSLFQLPIPGAEAAGSNVLAYRNMTRAASYAMPSGQAVAAKFGLPVMTDEQLGVRGTAFEGVGVPLWYYVLSESALEGGRVLGPVGSHIVRATMLAELERDRDSVLRGGRGFRPSEELAGEDGQVAVSDILKFAGVVPEEEEG